MPDPGTTSPLYSARPTLWLDDEERPELADGLSALLVEETTAGLYRCEATFANWGQTPRGVGFLYLDRQTLDFGKTLKVSIGSRDAGGQVFEGRITGIEAHYPHGRAPQLTVLAEDRLQDLRMTRRTRTFEDVSDADVLDEIARAHSLRAEVDVDGPTHRVLAQVNQSDLAFLRARARAIDAELWIEGDVLHAQARARREADAVTLTYGQGLRDFSVLADVARQRTALAVSGWDVAAKQEVTYEATEAAVGGELGGDEGGASVLEAAFGARVDRVVHLVPFNQDEARTLAEASYRAVARQFVTGRADAEGDARLRVGGRVTLQGLGGLFDGAYYVTEARHLFEGRSGYRTRLAVERPGFSRL